MHSCEATAAGRQASVGGLRSLPLLAVLLALPIAPVASLGAENPGCPGSPPESGLPPYDFRYTNPYYATIAGYLSIKEPELKDLKSYKLKIASFRKKMPVRAIIQPQEAPLVVVLMGVDGRADGPLGTLWPSWFAGAGCHVLTFDSTFLPNFVDISGHGVTGNLKAEAERVKEVIAAFLEHSELRGKVQKIGLVGMSYGGLQALLLGQMAAAGQLPFKVEAIQAYSPPIKLHKTGELIDRWFQEDRWQYTLVELAGNLSGHKPVGPDQPVPFEDSLMRAGIAAIFRLNLADVVVRNDVVYRLHQLPSGNEFDDQYVKQEHAKLWGYTRFINNMAFLYWREKAGMQSVSDLTGPAELGRLIENQPPCTVVILAEDDPFNTPEDFAEFKAAAAKRPVLFVPRGGHLGYVNEAWTKAKLLTLFKGPAEPTSATQAPR